MCDGSDRVAHRRRPVRKPRRSECRFASKASVDLPPQRSCDRPIVVGRELHEEVMRVLPIVNRVALAHLAVGQKIDEATGVDRPWLRAQHRAQAESSAAERPPAHHHEPVHAAGLMRLKSSGAMDLTGLVEKLPEGVPVEHHVPVAESFLEPEHRGVLRQPCSARSLARVEERLRIRMHIVVMLGGRCRLLRLSGGSGTGDRERNSK